MDDVFAAYYDRMLLFNGLEVRNVDHEVCTILTKTGDTGGHSPDWSLDSDPIMGVVG